jgi:hypothetical protein
MSFHGISSPVLLSGEELGKGYDSITRRGNSEDPIRKSPGKISPQVLDAPSAESGVSALLCFLNAARIKKEEGGQSLGLSVSV